MTGFAFLNVNSHCRTFKLAMALEALSIPKNFSECPEAAQLDLKA
jgi:hypothetical protein